MHDYAVDADRLKPYILPWIEAVRSGSVTPGTGGGLAAHELNSPYHLGQLGRSQAPWVATDIASAVASHALLPDVHHAQQHSIVGGDHTLTGAKWSIVGATALNTLGLITPSSAPGGAEAILKSSSAGDLTLPTFTATTKISVPLIDTASGTLSLRPANTTVQVVGAVRSTAGTTDAGGAIAQGVIDAGNSYAARAWFGHNARWDYGSDLWVIDAIGANDANGFLLRNAAAAIDVIFHTSTGATARTMDHATFTAGTKFTMTSAGRLGILNTSPSYELDVTGTARVTTSLTTPLITTVGAGIDLTLQPADDIVLTPGSNIVKLSSGKVFQSDNYASQTTGMRITHDGQADFRYLFVDEMHAKSFIADLEQALAGGQIIAKSVAVLYLDFTAPAAGASTTITVRDLPSATGMACFQNSDYIRIRKFSRSGGSLDISDCWGTVVLDTSYGTSGFDSSTKTQRYTFTRSTAPNAGAMTAGTVVDADAIILDYGTSGNGFYEVNAIDGMYAANSPYAQIVTWSGHPRSATVRARLGNLYGIFASSGEYGLYAGGGTADTDQYLRISNSGVRLNNVPLRLYSGSTQKVNIDSAGTDVWIGIDSTQKKLSWDGTTLNVVGAITVTGGNAAKTDFSNISATLDNVPNGSTYFRTTANQVTGAGRAYTALNSSNNLVTSVIPASAITPSGAGLYLGSNYMGYYDNSSWKTYIDSSGNMKLLGNASNNYIQWAAASNKLQGVGGGVEQWYADATDGKLYAAGGSIGMDSTGLWLRMNSSTGWATANAITFRSAANWNTVDAALLTRTVTSSRYVSLLIDPNTTPVGLEIVASPAAQMVNITHDLTVQGNVDVTGAIDAIVGVTVNGTDVSLVGHTHSYLSLSGGTLTGTLITDILRPATNNTKTVGDASYYYNAGYFNNLYVNTIVGTPSYSHTHAAGDITSGTLDENRIPHTWTGALTLDVDSAGTSNYIRWLTDVASNKLWDFVGRAHDFATSSQQNDLILQYYDGSNYYVAFQADSVTRVIDFAQTPTVGGTAVSLVGHTHDDRYFTESESDARFAALSSYNSHVANVNAHHAQSHVLATTAGLGGDHTVSGLTTGQVLRATGATTAQFMGLTSGDITTALGYTPVSNARSVSAGSGLSGGGALSADITISLSTPGTLTALTSNSATGAHTHTITSSSAPGAAASLLASSAAGNLTLPTVTATTKITVPLIDTASGTLSLRPANTTVQVVGALRSTAGTTDAGGAIAQGVIDAGNSYAARAWFGHNARWDYASDLWVIDAIGANDANGFLLRNAAAAIDVVFHTSTGATARTMDHATFTAGTKFTMTSAGRLGILNTSPSYELDVTGTARVTTAVVAPLVSAPGTLYLNAATGNTVEMQVNGVSQWTASDARLNPRSTIAMDIGDYNRKIRTLHAAEMYVETLVAQDVMATLGGRVMVAPTTTLIADLSNSAPSALYTNLIAYWKLDEASGNRADSKGSNTLTDTNTVTSTTGKQSNAAVFTKANSEYLTVADNSSLSVGDIDFYFSCWIYPTLNDASDQYIAAKGGSSGNRAWELRIDWVNARLRFSVYNPSDTATTVNSANSSIAVNTWYFVECWHDSVGNVIGVSINNGTAVTAAHTTGVKDDTGPFQLGARNASGFYQGNIDEFGFWKYMPSSGDRTFLFNSGAGRTYANVADWTTIDVKHNSLTAGTYIYMQAAPAGVPQVEALQVTANGSAVSGGYRYPVIRNLDGTGNNTWVAGDAVVSLGSAVGHGYIDLTSTATIHNQYGPTMTVFARTSTATWNGTAPVVTSGNLRSFVDYSTDEYGQAGGNDLTLNPASGFAGYTIDRTNGLRLFNTELKLYSGATESIRLNNSVGLRIITGSGAINRVSWYNAIGGYEQANIFGDLSGGTASLNLRAVSRDVGTGAFAGYADVILSNATTTSAVKLLSYDGSTNRYFQIDQTGASLTNAALDMNGNDIVDVGKLNVAPASTTVEGVIINMPPSTAYQALRINYNGTQRQQAYTDAVTNRIWLLSMDSGTGTGAYFVAGRNSNASTPAAGFFQSENRAGTTYYQWVDASGNARIGTTAPTNAQDGSGTVVGTQTSSLDSKNIIEPFTDYGRALNAIIDAPLFDFTYKSGAFGSQRFTGIVTDYAPTFGMDRDDTHPAGKSLNEITAHGYTFAAIKALHARIEELENQVRILQNAN